MTAPVNDNYADAILISGTSGIVTASTVDATLEAKDTRPMIWYKWVTPEAGILTIDTLQMPRLTPAGGLVMTNLAQYRGDNYNTATQVAFGDFIDWQHSDYRSQCSGKYWEAGVEVHIGVYCQTQDDPLDVILHWSFAAQAIAPPPPNPTSPPANDYIENAIVLTGINGSIDGNTYLNSGENTGGDSAPSGTIDDHKDYGSVWYKWSSPYNGYMRFRATQPQGGQVYNMWVLRHPNLEDAFMDAVAYTESPDGDWLDYKYVVTADTTYWIGVTMDGGYARPALTNFTLTWTSQPSIADANGVISMPVTDEFTPAYSLVYLRAIDEVWVMHARADGTTPPSVLGRFKESTGELLGYIQYTYDIYDPLVYDAFRKRVWTTVSPYASGQRIATSWDILTKQNKGTIPITRSVQSGDKFNPVDGYFWQGGIFQQESPPIKYKKVDPLTGAVLGTYLADTSNLGHQVYDTFFTTTGDHWILYGGNQYTYDALSHFDEATGTIDASFAFNEDPAFKLKRVMYDEDRQVFWVMLTNAWDTALPQAQWQDKLVEFTISSRTVANSYDIPYTYQGAFYDYVTYDTYRKQVVILDAEAVITAEQETNARLLAFDTVTGQQVYYSPLASTGQVVAAPTAPWVMGYNAFYRIQPPPPPENLDIINDRDVWLQSFTLAQRFETTQVQNGDANNLGQSQQTGIVLTGAKKLSLTAPTQAFRITERLIEPPSITITPTLRNLSGPPSYSVISGSAALTPVGDNVRVDYATMGSDSVTIKATLSGYEDQITLVKLVTGGTAMTAFLTNESESVICDAVGNVMSYIGASGDFRLFEGAFEQSLSCIFIVAANPDDVLFVIDNKGHYSMQGIPTNVDSATVTLKATYHGTDYLRDFKIIKLKAAAGSSADPARTLGPDGKRLPINLTIPILGLSWSDTKANDALIPYGGPGRNDVVTEYNSVSNFRQTRFFDTVRWQTLDAKIDGNLLVTGSIGADALSANAVTAITGTFNQVVTDQITANNATINTLTAQQIAANNATIANNLTAGSITTAMLAAGAVTADKIAAGAITASSIDTTTLRVNGTNIDPNAIATGHIVNNAVSVPATASGSPMAAIPGTFTETVGTVTYAAPANVLVNITVSMAGGTGGPGAGGATYYNIDVTKNGSVVASNVFTAPAGQVSSSTLSKVVSVGAETDTWGFSVYVNGSGNLTLYDFAASFMGAMK